MSHVYNYIKFIMSIYNTSQKNNAVIRSDKGYFDEGAFVWDESLGNWVSLAESNQVLSYSYLKNNSIQMTTGTVTANDLSSSYLQFNATINNVKENSTLTSENLVISSGGDSNTLTANTIEIADDYKNDLNISAGAINMNNTSSDTNPSLKLTYQGLTATSLQSGTTQLTGGDIIITDNQSDHTLLAPGELTVTNGSKQTIDITPVQVSITGADDTNVDLQSSFIKINNSSGTTVANLSQSGLVLSNGSSSTTLTPTSLDGSAITCSTLSSTGKVTGGSFGVSGGTSAFTTDESTLLLTNSADSSTCKIQSSSVVLSNNGKTTNLSLDGSVLVKADIDKLHNLPSTIPSYSAPVTYFDSTPYTATSYQVGGTISDSTQYHYVPSSGSQFNVGDLIQFFVYSDIVKGSTDYAFLRIYLPQANEFAITGESETPLSLYNTNTMGSTANLRYPIFTVRGPSGAISSTYNPTITINGIVYRPYFLIFDGYDAGSDVSVRYIINIRCVGNVCAASNGTGITHNT